MGILDLLGAGKPTPEKFAKLFEEGARKSGFNKPMRFDAAEFCLIVEGGPGAQVISLANAYHDYCAVPKAERETVLAKYAAILNPPEIPSDFNIAKAHLMPIIRARAYLEDARLMFQARNMDFSPADRFAPFSEDAVLMPAYDTEHASGAVDPAELQKWGVSFDAAMQAALANLRRRSPVKFADLGGGVFMGQWNDAYDTSRIMLPEVVAGANVAGDPVMMIPTRDCLLVTSSKSLNGQMKMVDFARQKVENDNRFTSAAMYTYRDGKIVQNPPENAGIAAKLSQLGTLILASQYNGQKPALDKINGDKGQDIFVASYQVATSKASGRLTSLCSWTKGARSLLPKTDLVAMVTLAPNGNDRSIKLLAWSDMAAIAGDMLRPAEGYPVRYLVDGFPRADELERAPAATFPQ